MKKLLALLAVVLTFTFMGMAQTSTSSSMGQSSQTTTTKSKKTTSGEMGGMSHENMGKTGKAKKESTLTGCLSAQPDANGNYTLSNGRYKKGVEVTPADKVKAHAGHQVELKGEWTGAATEGSATTSASSKGKTFEVASLKHLSETCKEAAGGGTTGTTHKGKKAATKGDTAKQ